MAVWVHYSTADEQAGLIWPADWFSSCWLSWSTFLLLLQLEARGLPMSGVTLLLADCMTPFAAFWAHSLQLGSVPQLQVPQHLQTIIDKPPSCPWRPLTLLLWGLFHTLKAPSLASHPPYYHSDNGNPLPVTHLTSTAFVRLPHRPPKQRNNAMQ